MKITLLALSFLVVSILHGQMEDRMASILRIPRTQVEKLDQLQSKTITWLPGEFAESTFNFSTVNATLSEATVIRVYYVYTRYRLSSSFDQSALDLRRLEWLRLHYPFLLDDPLIQWGIIEQTGCTDFTQGDDYFHGFVVIHRPVMSAEERQNEIDLVSAYLENPTDYFTEPTIDPIAGQLHDHVENDSSGTSSNPLQTARAEFPDGEPELLRFFQKNIVYTSEAGRFDDWVDITFTVSPDGSTDSLTFNDTYPDAVKTIVESAIRKMPPWDPALESGHPVFSEVNLQVRVSYSPHVKGMYTRDGVKPNLTEGHVIIGETGDEPEINLMTAPTALSVKSTAVYRGLDILLASRRTALVMDVTGSMTTHIAGMKNWIMTHATETPFTSYTFFNDGDRKNTKEKKIGETGGIYMTKVMSEMDKTIQTAMQKGSGGEAPENDLEAVRYAFSQDAAADAVVLIGDNYSEVRDISLLDQITKPVHVILCAAPKFVRCEYLKIARETGGMFILNGSVIDLSTISKGETILIQGVDYAYNGSDFEIKTKEQVYY